MPNPVTASRSSDLAVDIEELWAVVASAEGINAELRPVLTMRMPSTLRGAALDELPVCQPLGRAWLLLGGLLPVEYDDLALAEVDPPRLFVERSRLLSARSWQHRRELTPITDGSTRVTDPLRLVPRWLAPGAVARLVLGALFGHRHRRLRRRYGSPT